MKKLILFSVIALLLSATIGCEKDENKEKEKINYKYPPCLQVEIDNYLATYPVPPKETSDIPTIKKYKCGNKIVYIYEGYGVYDQISYVVDMSCDTIGEIGGWVGNTCKCKLEYLETVWKDNRKK